MNPAQCAAAVALAVSGGESVVRRIKSFVAHQSREERQSKEDQSCLAESLVLVHRWEEYGQGAIRLSDEQVEQISANMRELKRGRRQGKIRMRASAGVLIDLYESGSDALEESWTRLEEAVDETDETISRARKGIRDALWTVQRAVAVCIRGDTAIKSDFEIRAWHGVTMGVMEDITIEKLAPGVLCGTWLRPTGCGGVAVDEEHEDVHAEVKEVLTYVRVTDEQRNRVMESLLKHEDVVLVRIRHLRTEMEELRIACASEMAALGKAVSLGH